MTPTVVKGPFLTATVVKGPFLTATVVKEPFLTPAVVKGPFLRPHVVMGPFLTATVVKGPFLTPTLMKAPFLTCGRHSVGAAAAVGNVTQSATTQRATHSDPQEITQRGELAVISLFGCNEAVPGGDAA